MNDDLSRRAFIQKSTLVAASGLAKGTIAQAAGPELVNPHPLLTPANAFNTVARGNPKPHSLTGQDAIHARLTPESWRLEITADPFTEKDHVAHPASIQRALTLAGGNAIDLPMLTELGKTHGVKFIKAMQCLNIPTPLGQGLWEGVPLREVLRLCGKLHNVRRIYYYGFHNNDPKQVFQSSVSYTEAMETPPDELPVFLAYKLNGEPISLLRGGPVRMVVPWAYGFKSIKWLQHIFVTNDYRANDTYALQNNDPESHLKTAAYADGGPKTFKAGEPLVLTGQVIAGRSGLKRVEYGVRSVRDAIEALADDHPELLRGPWIPCPLLPPPDWKQSLPAGNTTRDILGFDPSTGQPTSWPLPYGMASFAVDLRGLKPGTYEVRFRAVDRNDFAQPEPRPLQKSGKNALDVRRFEVV
ncbi:MAG: hypothetical protein ACI9TH_001154 [Kiritimatiellia bacterium]|jgi:hypothetical protein